jgi:hypothetical protein
VGCKERDNLKKLKGGETIMSYKCPVCGKNTATNIGMRGHILNARSLFKEHWQWMKSHGINPHEKVATGDYKPLMELVEKECKIKD